MSSEPAVHGSTQTRWDTAQFAIVTLWGGRAHAEHTLDWLATAELPPNTVLYWLDNSGGKFTAQLRAAWEQRLRQRFLRLVFLHGGAPYRAKDGVPALDPGRHIHIAKLYNRIFTRVFEEVVITLEDDMVPPVDGVRSLLELLEASAGVGLVGGAYRDRLDPRRIVAARHKRLWLDFPQFDTLPKEPFEVGLAGGGFTLMTNRALQHALPVRCQRFGPDYSSGWDGNLCADITAYGYRVMVHPAVRCAHLCPEVLAYEASLKRSKQDSRRRLSHPEVHVP